MKERYNYVDYSSDRYLDLIEYDFRGHRMDSREDYEKQIRVWAEGAKEHIDAVARFALKFSDDEAEDNLNIWWAKNGGATR